MKIFENSSFFPNDKLKQIQIQKNFLNKSITNIIKRIRELWDYCKFRNVNYRKTTVIENGCNCETIVHL